MTGVVPANPKIQFFSSAGAPLANGTVDVYLAGTVTRSNTWQDLAQATLNANPIVLDSRGEALIYLDSALTYKFVLKNAGGVEQYTVDNISGVNALNVLSFLQAGTGAVARSAQDKMREIVSVKDYGAIGDGSPHPLSERYATLAAAQAVYPFVTALTQQIDWAAIQAALDYADDTRKACYLPDGAYRIGETLYRPLGVDFYGDGNNIDAGGIAPVRGTSIRPTIDFTSGDMLRVKGETLSGSRRVWNGSIRRMTIYGNPLATSQYGISMRNSSGQTVTPQDTTLFADLLVRSCKSGGIEFPDGALPLHVVRVNCLWNDGPGILLVGGANIVQGIHFFDVSGDGNNGGLIKLVDCDANGSIVITSLKSEMRINEEYGSVARQQNPIVTDNCDGCPISIIGATHISSVPDGGNFQKPGDLITAVNGTPVVTWTGVAIRVRAGDTGTDPNIIATGTVSVPYTQKSGFFGDDKTVSFTGNGTFKHVAGTKGVWQSAGPTDSGYQAQGTTPGFTLYETDAAADEKAWSDDASGGDRRRRAVSDSNVATVYETALRTGGVVTAMDWSVPIQPGVFTIATLPAAASVGTHLTMITDPVAGRGRVVYSTGTEWRYVSDDSAV